MTRMPAVVAVIASALAQSPDPSRPVVVLHGWVEQLDGTPAASVQPSDFQAFVDGVEREIVSIVSHRVPASAIVLLDTSRSMRWQLQPPDHLEQFALSLTPSDRLMIATFGARKAFPGFRPGGVGIRDEIRRAIDIDADEGYGSSPVWDAIYDAVGLLAHEPGPRAILLLTDGRTTGNERGLVDVADYAMSNGVAITVVLQHSSQRIPQGTGSAALVQPGAPLQGLATYTGGMYFTYPQQQDASAIAIFKLVAASLVYAQEFTVSIPTRDGGPHRIAIRPKPPELKVHAPIAFVAR